MKRLMRFFQISVLAASGLFSVSCASNRVKSSVAAAVNQGAQTNAGSDAAKFNVDALDDDEEFDEYAAVDVYDPWEGFNRGMFRINDGFYTIAMRPVAKGYKFIFPKQVRKGISNAFYNVKFPVRAVNGVLQGKFKRAGQETGAFVVNSVAGVGGLFKVSDHIQALADIPPEDTGQTFGAWGMGHGPYVVLPIVGPCSLRDTAGYGFDQLMNPVNWGIYSSEIADITEIPAYVNLVQATPEQLDLYDAAVENAVDPYIAARSSYLQNRKHAVEK